MLDPLLRVRSLREQAQRRDLAALLRRQRELEGILFRHQEQVAEGKEGRRVAVTGRVDLLALRSHTQASLHLIRRANQVVLQLAGVHQQVDRARTALLAASRDRRSVELLRERRFSEWQADMNAMEGRAMDDVATAKTFRREDHP